MTAQPFRLATYNLSEGAANTYNRLIEFVHEAQLDLLCLQEVNGWQDNDLARCRDFSDKLLFADFAYTSTNTEYKLATFAKHTLASKTSFVDGFWHGACVTRLSVGDQQLTVINLHLDPWKEESRVREVERLLELVDLKQPTIVVGDFNSLSRADQYPPQLLDELRSHGISKFGTQELSYAVTDKLTEAGFIDVAAKLGKCENTVPSKFSTDKDHELPVRIDYVFVSPDLAGAVTDVEVIKTELTDAISDHYPIVVSLQLGQTSPPATTVAPPPSPAEPPVAPVAPPPPSSDIQQAPDGSIVVSLHNHDQSA